MNPAVEIKGLSVSAPGKSILNGLNMLVGEDSFNAVIGANGAGKSTLLKAICGLSDFQGSIKIFGRELSETDRSIIGYLPQNNISEKNCPVSVFEAVSIGRYAKNGIFKAFTQEDRRVVENAMKIADISHIADMPVGNISGGEAQKVSVARILAQQPRIVLLDEPQSNLDPQSQKNFLAFVEKLYKKFKFTCLMVTHDIDLIPDICNKVFMLKDSKIALETENKDIKEKAAEYKIYG